MHRDKFVGTLLDPTLDWQIAMFHNPRKLRVKRKWKKKFVEPETGNEQESGYLAKTFEEIATGVSFNVYTTHLKSKKGFELMREN